MTQPTTPLVRPVANRPNETTPVPPSGLKARASRYLNTNWIRCLIIALVGTIVRVPALQGERIWDDHYLVHDNPFMKSPALILEAFRHYLFLDSVSMHYRPVQNISYMV